MNLRKPRLNVGGRYSLIGLLLIGVLVLPFLVLGQAHAVSKVWDGGCGADTTWSCANNWSDNVVPGSGDTVTFDSTSSNDSVVDASFSGTITQMNINAGYTGTISLGHSLAIVNTFNQADGTFTAGSQSLIVTSSFVLSGGSFTASSGTTSVGGDFTISGSSTFNANGGTMNFNGTTDGTLSCNNVVFNLVTVTHTSGYKTVGNDCNLPLGNNPTIGAVGSGTQNNMNGTAATGFGSGGGGAGWYGGMGGNGLYGGGGGGAAGYTVNNRIGGAGGGGVVVFSPVGGSDEVRTSGSSYTVPIGVTSVKVWAVGAGGGGAGATGIDATSGGAGGAGGVAYKTFTVIPGEVITYSLGSSGAGGIDAVNGNNGGNTIVTSGVTTMTGGGGAGGQYNNDLTAAGGSFSGGDGGATGGIGSGISGDNGGGGGGGIGGADGVSNGHSGGTGGQAIDVSGLFAVVSGLGYPTTGPGVGGTDGSGSGNPSIYLDGTLSGSGTLTMGGTLSDLELNTGSTLSGFSGLSVNALGVNNTFNASSYNPFTVSGDFDVYTEGSFTAPSGIASFGANFTLHNSTFDANGGTLNFNGTGDAALACENSTFNLVTFTGTYNGYITVESDCNLPLGNNPTIRNGYAFDLYGNLTGSGGLNVGSGEFDLEDGSNLIGFNSVTTDGRLGIFGNVDLGSLNLNINGALYLGLYANFTAPSGTAAVSGSFINNNGGTFHANGGTVALDGTGQTIYGNTTFYNLSKTASSADTLTFAAGSIQTVQGKLTLKGGGSSRLLSLVSDTPGTPWLIDAEGDTTVAYVKVSDSDASSGNTIVACASVDDGGNSGWLFNPSSCIPPAPPASSVGGSSNPTAAITNFELLQASLINQQQESQAAGSGFYGDNSLPSKIYDFVRQFPHRRELMKAAGQFLWALLIILIIVILIWLYRVWRHFRKQKEEADEDGGPTVMTPPAWPPIDSSATGPPLAGTTIHPTILSQEPAPLFAAHKPLSGGQNSLGTAR